MGKLHFCLANCHLFFTLTVYY